MPDGNASAVAANRVRYIKLGQGGRHEAECFDQQIMRMGFGSARHFDLCSTCQWEALAERYKAEGRKQGKATENSNQVRTFFEDDGSILWITFSRRLLWWAFIDGNVPAQPHQDMDGTFRPVRGQWRSTDILGTPLHMDGLSGHLTQLAGYRGTSCDVKAVDYFLRRVNGERLPVVAEAEALSEQLRGKIVQMLRLLTPKDFELLVDLVFSGSGWRRLGVVGGTEKTVDMELVLPTTGEKAFVQCKSTAKQAEFNEEYLEAFADMTQFGRMFYVFHTGKITCAHPGVTIIGPEQFAAMVFDAGLTSWLIQRVS
ncbi:MAG: hypothetical protein ACM3Q1_02655 [Bacteroidales bacterium]